MPDQVLGRCGNCSRVWPEEQLDEIRDFWSRVSPGEEMPLGQCPAPECGALCHVVRPREKIVLELQGGRIQGIRGIPSGWCVEVRDFDVRGRSADLHHTLDGRPYVRTVWGAGAEP